jgi:hypothetical protein
MTNGTMQVFSGSAITPEELLALAQFAAPAQYVDYEHLRDTAENLVDWTDHDSATIADAIRLAVRRHVGANVTELLRASAWISSEEPLARAS